MELRLLCVLAHPDDESLALGGTLARYTHEGVAAYLVTATRGEHGWFGSPSEYPGPEALGRRRESELMAAAKVLGLREVSFLDYVDGQLDQADAQEAVARIVAHIRRLKPQVVITFGPDGVYGHPDHIAICQFATAAAVVAADPQYAGAEPHRVSKLYYIEETQELAEVFQAVFGDVVMNVDGIERRLVPWHRWALSTHLDTAGYERTAWEAVKCHRSQLPAYSRLENISDAQRAVLWGSRMYYRAFSLVNGGRKVERDLFEGLRPV